VLNVEETRAEVALTIDHWLISLDAAAGACGRWGRIASGVDAWDLICAGCPATLIWLKRRCRCVDADCVARTSTERTPSASLLESSSPCAPAPRSPRWLGELALRDAWWPETLHLRMDGWRPSCAQAWLGGIQVAATDLAGPIADGFSALQPRHPGR
jgi:hypothetical protein